MNESIEPNVDNAEESFLEEEITEPNGNGISGAAAIETNNLLGQKGKPVIIAEGPVIEPPPIRQEFSSEVIV